MNVNLACVKEECLGRRVLNGEGVGKEGIDDELMV